MPDYAAFLRAVNVGGTGKLPMATLRGIAEDIGATRPETYIASGNLVLSHPAGPDLLRTALESGLAEHGCPTAVILRTSEQLDGLLAANPFDHAAPNRVLALLTDTALPDDPARHARNLTSEEIALAPGALFIHYPDGQGRSRLVLPEMKEGTARNLNTLRKLQAMLAHRS